MKLLQLLLAFLKVGILGYGGGPSFIPLVKIEAVNNYNWLSAEEFTDVLAMANALPGPIVTKMAGYIGYKVNGIFGTISALLGVVFPSLIAMLILYKLMNRFKDSPKIGGMIKGVRPVVVVLLIQVIIDMIPSAYIDLSTIIISLVSFVLIYFVKIHPALIILAALTYGAIFPC